MHHGDQNRDLKETQRETARKSVSLLEVAFEKNVEERFEEGNYRRSVQNCFIGRNSGVRKISQKVRQNQEPDAWVEHEQHQQQNLAVTL
jgi:hypothetical protein